MLFRSESERERFESYNIPFPSRYFIDSQFNSHQNYSAFNARNNDISENSLASLGKAVATMTALREYSLALE